MIVVATFWGDRMDTPVPEEVTFAVTFPFEVEGFLLNNSIVEHTLWKQLDVKLHQKPWLFCDIVNWQLHAVEKV